MILDTYSRISEDPNDQRRGVTRQAADTREVVEARGATLGVEHVENDTSAFKKRKVPVTDASGNTYMGYRVIRPVWHAALQRLREGKADGLVVYDLDRLAREPRDLEDAIEVVEHYGKTVLSATASEIDLTTGTGRTSARLHVIMANKASADTARRVRRAHLENAQKGKAVGGRRPFGWQADKVTLNEYEAGLLRQAAADVLAGTRLATIVKRWNEAGVPTVTGGTWTGGVLLQLLRSPRLAGWRIHRVGGSEWSKVPPVALDKQGQPVRGKWEPIIDHATHLALVEALASKPDSRAVVPRRNARRYLMTGLLRCAACNGVMYGNKVGESHFYRCDTPKCSNSASGKGVDAWVAERVVERSELVSAQDAPSTAGPDARLVELNTRIDDVNAMVEDVMAVYRNKGISAATAFGNVAKLEESLVPVVAERDALLAETALSRPEVLDADTWGALDVDRRRAAAERALRAVYVHKATRPGNRFDSSRLDPVWREGV
ncbi:recombinase family protein [Blastococcus sp. HT6-30]|uniref:recombinase family protein n=1 Tax=Blastococcus sp. HT6-30 TaxID=3144843 RepID=UPI003218F290